MVQRKATMRLVLCFLTIMLATEASWAQSTQTTYVSFGRANALLVEPAEPGPNSHIALVYNHPGTSLNLLLNPVNNFDHRSGPELASRGYRVLLLNHNSSRTGYEPIFPAIGQSIEYLRDLPGVDTVLLLTHSIGGPVMAFYQNVAENGPGACQGPEKIYSCRGELTDLPTADGIVFLDVHLGEGFRFLTYVDPAIDDEANPMHRNAALDMFAEANGYDPADGGATYSQAFLKDFFTAQGARNERLIQAAEKRLSAIDNETSLYKNDEPFEVASLIARALQSDVSLISRTRSAHPLLKADGTVETQIVQSVRPPSGRHDRLGTYEQYSVRQFLASEALRTTADYMMTEDSITGVDWASSINSAPSNLEGVQVPVLILTMSCHYFVVPNELLFEHAASKDKQLVYVEGASHSMTPCRPEFGDTVKRTFDYVDGWLSDSERF